VFADFVRVRLQLFERQRRLVVVLLALLQAACASVALSPGSAAPEIPFEFTRSLVLVQARVQGQGPFACLVDTGANPSVIDLALARKLGLRLSGEAGAAEGIGSDQVKIHETEMLAAVGNATASPVAAVAVDLAALSRAFGRPIDCILGQSWLATRVTEIDYPRGVLRQRQSRRTEASCSTMPMRFWMDDDLMPLVTAQVNGQDVAVSLDTGSNGVLKLFPLEARRAGVEVEPASEGSVTGVRGRAAVSGGRATRVQFGPLALSDVRITVGERNEGESAGRSGNLGNGLLRLGVLTLDYPARRIRVCAPGS
jgi:predicted aspartyl protease